MGILLALSTFPLYGQDTLFFNSSLNITTAGSALYFGFVMADETNPGLVSEVLYYLSGEKRSESSLSDYEEKVKEGKHKNWYIDGVLRRESFYDDGDLVEGWCFNPDGTDTLYYPYETMPEFPGDNEALYAFVARNIRYPPFASEMGSQGLVVLEFIVNRDGSITDIKVVRGVTNDLNNEAMRIIRAMPNWTPAHLDGEVIRYIYNMPIRFLLQ